MVDKLGDDALPVVFVAVFETGEGAHADYVAVTSHDRNRLKEVFRFVAVHYHAAFCLEFPCALIDIEHNHVHAEVHRRFLGAEPCAQARIEEYHQQSAVFAEIGMGETVTFYLKCLIYGLAQRADVCYVCELSHSLIAFFNLSMKMSASPSVMVNGGSSLTVCMPAPPVNT